jgi:Transposase DDE domain
MVRDRPFQVVSTMPDIKRKWSFTCLPPATRILFKGMPGVWRHRHQLVFCWLIVMQIVTSGARTLSGLSQSAPGFITEWRFRRLLSAGYWSLKVLLHWFAEEAIKSLPTPENKVVYVIADGSKKDKRGQKNPAAQKGRMNEHHAWFFGIKFVVLMVAWDNYRIPVDFQMVLPKGHPDYKKENELFRHMLSHFQPPDWAKVVIVVGDAAFAAKDNMKLIQARDKADSQRRWGFVFAIARTWNMADGKSLRNLVNHTPHSCYRQTWIPRLPDHKGRKTFWIFEKLTSLKHLGDVTVVLTKKGRNVGPKNTKLLVTNLLELNGRQVIDIYQRRWAIEILFKELKSGLGLGEHQVTKKLPRIEKSLGIALIAYLFLLRARKDDIKPGKPWSIFQLKTNFTMDMIQKQFQHSMALEINKWKKAA